MPFDSVNYTPTDPVLRVLMGLRAYHSVRENWCDTGMFSMGGARCIMAGAVYVARKLKVTDGDGNTPIGVLPALLAACHPYGVVTFNEKRGTTHAELLEMYDRAIAMRATELERV